MLDATTTAAHFLGSLAQGQEKQSPYRHWLLDNMLPSRMVDDIVALPVAPPAIEDTQGRRETHNSKRWFFGVEQQQQFPVCHDLAEALQSHEVVHTLERRCAVNLKGSSLRIEYCLDTDGFWLEPHTDIGAKFFTMLIYLTDSAPGENWGTDIFASPTEHAGAAPFIRNRGLIFIPGSDTWHGFVKRRITGVRRSLIVNYVTEEWRSRHELAFPEQPVG
ncbi:2OG-Fe(II) oxygenase [Acidocella aromatica]|uniref:2OG-Fe(II) oxygenase n=1 Tax=Acidocella aromatica TaxID=1303579 RepID=A0A840VI88_9PROT|nr:2OG-Fe(II) oxygenase [Acidocella aromatica]MBB5372009.1 hypothetical protein [Acidocella aromatica]